MLDKVLAQFDDGLFDLLDEAERLRKNYREARDLVIEYMKTFTRNLKDARFLPSTIAITSTVYPEMHINGEEFPPKYALET